MVCAFPGSVQARVHVLVCWLNVRLLGQKTTTVCDLIEDHRLDVAILTETWHRSAADILVRMSCPTGYSAVDAV